jgi:GH15 family glucan-1,4-alpha-glucosidase
MGYKPISDYGIIGNMLSAALVSRDGSIDWCCLPRFDSPSIFAAILDDEKGGRFHIRPQTSFESEQTYIPNTNVLQTIFHTTTGTAVLTDFMPCYRTRQGRRIQSPEIHRLVQCTQGEVNMECIFEPELDYARKKTTLVDTTAGITVNEEPFAAALSSKIPFQIRGARAVARFILREGKETVFTLSYGVTRPFSVRMADSKKKCEGTIAFWRQLADVCVCSGMYRDAIVRSYLTLHLMVHSPTGAIIAAPTTSLPEQIGGERNWDYRYAWLRDASLTINAFSHLGHTEEAAGFMGWLLNTCGTCGPKAQMLYNIDLKNPPDERILAHLKGYQESRPVRIGNAAYTQRQLDVFGEILEAASNYLDIGGYIGHDDWKLLESFVEAAAELWSQPDSGIWEVRGGLYHFVHSKMMCWVALDRGIKVAQKLGISDNIERWQTIADRIREDIETRGWNPQRQSFTQHYDTGTLDASTLLIPLLGFLPITDERVKSTFERTRDELSWDGLLRRYRTDETDDGLSGTEGAFLWCSFWLVRNLILLNRLDEAKTLYEKLLSFSNHLGLFSEMAIPSSGKALGNFPQVLTHLGVITTGLKLNNALITDADDPTS